MRKEPQDRTRLRSSARRRALWVARQNSFKIELSAQQLDLIHRRWGPTPDDGTPADEARHDKPSPDDEEGRKLRRDRRALVAEALGKIAILLPFGLLLLIAVSLWLKSHGF